MLNSYSETAHLALLARYDFLDLCLLGETGTGKTFTARQIHDLSPRAKQPFIAVNCAELAPSLIEAELFGYEKGAFTGANIAKAGKFETAAGGTLFFDEIGELPANIQAKLLKVVEEKQVTRVGGNRERTVDVRIVYATHRDLTVLREDLRYRIAAHTVRLKPLRERPEDIVPLARQFLAEFNNKSGRVVTARNKTLALLEQAEWRGNVRELRTFIEKACLETLFAAGGSESDFDSIELTGELLINRLPSSTSSPLKSSGKLENYLGEIQNDLIQKALVKHNNNQTRAAKELGISRSGLIKKLKRINH